MLITAFFLGTVGVGVAVFLLDDSPKDPSGPLRYVGILLLTTAFAAQVYCMISGFQMLDGWAEQVDFDLTADEMRSISGRARGRGAAVLAAMQYWPYVLIGIHGFFAYHTGQALYDLQRGRD